MSSFDAGSISAKLVLSRDEFNRDLEAAKADADKFSGKDYTAKVKADTTAADKPLAATQAMADKLGKSSPTVKVNVDNAQATARIAQIQAQIQRLSNIIARPQVSPDTQKAYTQLDALNAELDELGKKQPTAKVEADTADAQAKIDALNVKLDRLEIRDTEVRVKASADLLKAQADLDKLQQSLAQVDSTTAAVKVDASGAKDAGSAMLSLIAGAAAVAPAFIVAGAGVVAFAALAIPQITQVIKAQSDMKAGTAGARAEYQALSQSQKTAIVSVSQLETSYKKLSAAVAPQVLTVFNEALGIANTILPHLVPLAKAGGDAVAYLVQTLGSVATDSQAQQFSHFLGQEIGPDMQAVAGLIPPLVHLLESLVTDLNPLAVATLHFASGLLSVVDGLSRAAPWLTDTAVAAVALYKPFTALMGLDIAGKFTNITGAVTKFSAAALAAKANAAFDTAIGAGLDAEAAGAAGAAVSMEGLSVAETAAATAGGALAAVNPLVWAVAAAVAIGVLAVKLASAKDAAQEFNTSIQNTISNSSLGGLNNTILASMVQTQQRVTTSTQAVTSALKDQQPAVTGIASRFEQNYSPALDRAAQSQAHYQQGLTQLQQQAGLVSTRVEDLSKKYGGTAAAMALLNEAGITSAQITDTNNAHWAQAQVEISAVDAAQKALELSTGRTTAASNAQGNKLVTTLLPAMQKVTGAEDALISVVTGGETAFAGFEQSIGQASTKLGAGSGLAQDAAAAGASLSGLNSQSLTLANDFYGSVIPAAQKVIDAVQAQQISTSNLTTVVGTEADQMLGYAGHNDAARASIVALINNALGPGTVSMKSLTTWTAQNSTSMSGFKEIIDTTTGSAAKLAGLIGQDLNAVMAQAVIDAHGGQQAFDGFAQSVLSGKTQGQAFTQQGIGVISSLLAQSGNAATAKKNFETFAINGLGESKSAADALWTSLSHQLLVSTASKAGESKTQFEQFATQLGLTKTAADKLWTSLHKVAAGSPYKANLDETGKGTFSIQQLSGSGIGVVGVPAGVAAKAAGGLITGGIRGKDSVVIAAMPGEVVVPTAMVSAGAVDHLRGRLPGFAAGGQVGGTASLPSQTTAFHNTFTSDVTSAMKSAMNTALKSAEKSAEAAQAAAAAAAASASGGGSLLHPTGSGGSVQALMQSMAASIGWTGAQWTDLYNVEMREAGFNLNATNPSSGAYGLAQFINGPSEYAQYGGNSTTAAGQITAMFNYIKQRYGTPAGAWAHEQAYNWYGGGTGGAKPGWAVTGERGRELVYMHGGETVLPHAATERVMAMHSAGTPGYASGTPNVASLISGAPSGGWSAHVAHLQHVLKVIADSLGIKGLGKTDIANLKSEQVHDNASLKTSTADLKILATARDKITKTTEPGLNKQISALNALAGIGKLSSAESSLLKTLKASLASQQAQLSKINVAINGKPAPAAQAATTAAASTDASDTSGTSTAASDSTTSSGAFTGVLPSAPGLGAPNITGGGTGGLGGIDNATLGISGYSSGVNASGYQITPSAGSGFQDWGQSSGGFDTSGIEGLLQRLIAVSQSAPAVTGSSFGASLNGLSRQAAIRSAYSTGAQL